MRKKLSGCLNTGRVVVVDGLEENNATSVGHLDIEFRLGMFACHMCTCILLCLLVYFFVYLFKLYFGSKSSSRIARAKSQSQSQSKKVHKWHDLDQVAR